MTSDLYSAGLRFARCEFTGGGGHAATNGLPMDTNIYIYIYQSNAPANSSMRIASLAIIRQLDPHTCSNWQAEASAPLCAEFVDFSLYLFIYLYVYWRAEASPPLSVELSEFSQYLFIYIFIGLYTGV